MRPQARPGTAHLPVMTTNPNRVQSGVPDGGQFATGTRAEPDVALAAPATPASYARSADRPDADTWHHPGWVPRGDAITAYDDTVGTYTIGDTLHVHAPFADDSYWVDYARPVLASLRRAGLSGTTSCYETGGHDARYDQEWQLQAPLLPDRGEVYFRVGKGVGRTFVSVRGKVDRYVESTGTLAELDQDELDSAVEDVVRAEALVDGWEKQLRRSGALRAYAVNRPSLSEDRDRPGVTEMRIRTSGMTDVVASIEGGKVTGVRQVKAGTHQPEIDREQAMATVGRAMGLTGGKRAGVPGKVEAMLAAAADTDSHPAVVKLLAAREATRHALP